MAEVSDCKSYIAVKGQGFDTAHPERFDHGIQKEWSEISNWSPSLKTLSYASSSQLIEPDGLYE